MVELRGVPQPSEINSLERQTDTNRSIVFQRFPGRLANRLAPSMARLEPADGHAGRAAPASQK